MRLQVQVLPARAGQPGKGVSFLEIASPSLTLEDLSISICNRFSRLYPHRKLNIYKLQDGECNDLDLTYTVGDVFSDKSEDKNSSVVRVLQHPEGRDHSLPRASGLRPRRPLKRRARSSLHEVIIESDEEQAAGPSSPRKVNSSERSQKRQKIHDTVEDSLDERENRFERAGPQRDITNGINGLDSDRHEESDGPIEPTSVDEYFQPAVRLDVQRSRLSPSLGPRTPESNAMANDHSSSPEVQVTHSSQLSQSMFQYFSPSIKVEKEIPSSSPLLKAAILTQKPEVNGTLIPEIIFSPPPPPSHSRNEYRSFSSIENDVKESPAPTLFSSTLEKKLPRPPSNLIRKPANKDHSHKNIYDIHSSSSDASPARSKARRTTAKNVTTNEKNTREVSTPSQQLEMEFVRASQASIMTTQAEKQEEKEMLERKAERERIEREEAESEERQRIEAEAKEAREKETLDAQKKAMTELRAQEAEKRYNLQAAEEAQKRAEKERLEQEKVKTKEERLREQKKKKQENEAKKEAKRLEALAKQEKKGKERKEKAKEVKGKKELQKKEQLREKKGKEKEQAPPVPKADRPESPGESDTQAKSAEVQQITSQPTKGLENKRPRTSSITSQDSISNNKKSRIIPPSPNLTGQGSQSNKQSSDGNSTAQDLPPPPVPNSGLKRSNLKRSTSTDQAPGRSKRHSVSFADEPSNLQPPESSAVSLSTPTPIVRPIKVTPIYPPGFIPNQPEVTVVEPSSKDPKKREMKPPAKIPVKKTTKILPPASTNGGLKKELPAVDSKKKMEGKVVSESEYDSESEESGSESESESEVEGKEKPLPAKMEVQPPTKPPAKSKPQPENKVVKNPESEPESESESIDSSPPELSIPVQSGTVLEQNEVFPVHTPKEPGLPKLPTLTTSRPKLLHNPDSSSGSGSDSVSDSDSPLKPPQSAQRIKRSPSTSSSTTSTSENEATAKKPTKPPSTSLSTAEEAAKALNKVFGISKPPAPTLAAPPLTPKPPLSQRYRSLMDMEKAPVPEVREMHHKPPEPPSSATNHKRKPADYSSDEETASSEEETSSDDDDSGDSEPDNAEVKEKVIVGGGGIPAHKRAAAPPKKKGFGFRLGR